MAERDAGLAADVPPRPPTPEDPEPRGAGEPGDAAARFRPVLAGQRQTNASRPAPAEDAREVVTDDAEDAGPEADDADSDGAPSGELRAALDELRRVLEVDSTAPPVRH